MKERKNKRLQEQATAHEQPNGTPKPALTLEEKLATDIQMMMGGTFDRWCPDADLDMAVSIMACAKLAAEGVAKKLTEALSRSPDPMTEERWNLLVQEACRNAIMEVTDQGPLINLAKNKTFAAAVAECTAATIAPAGSAWARAVAAHREEHMRNTLKAHGCPAKDVERVLAELRHQGK